MSDGAIFSYAVGPGFQGWSADQGPEVPNSQFVGKRAHRRMTHAQCPAASPIEIQ